MNNLKTNKLLITLIIGMFLISMASALVTDPDYRAQYYTDVNIIETCTVDGFPCGATYDCNITVTNPNEEVVIRNQEMTRNFPTYNYTFHNTSLLGDYKVNVYCTNTTFGGEGRNTILQVTTTGRPPEIKVVIFMLIISLVSFILGLYLHNYSIGFISGILFLLTGIYQMAYGFGDIVNLYTQAMAYIVLAFGLFIMLISGYEWLEDMS